LPGQELPCNVRLGWTAGVNSRAVAELTLTGMMTALRNVTPLNLAIRSGERPLQRLGRPLRSSMLLHWSRRKMMNY